MGVFQWITLATKFEKSRTIWWIPVYSLGLIPAAFGGLVIEEYLHQFIFALIASWLIAGGVFAWVQWLILRKYILRGYMLIPCNLLGLLFFIGCLVGGVLISQLIYCFGLPLGFILGGSIYGGILGIGIVSSLKKDVILRM